MVMRAMFNELNRHTATQPLRLARELQRHTVCIDSGLLNDGECASRDEWFMPSALPSSQPVHEQVMQYRLSQPVDQMLVARDPRIPDEDEALELQLNQSEHVEQVQWLVNDQLVATTPSANYAWPLQGGEFRVRARVFSVDGTTQLTPTVSFTVR
jgi:penicillin-binding protein 1C